jgi:hypothetical protein
MLDFTCIITNWNPGAERFKGYFEAEIRGQHFSRFYTDEDRRTGLPARSLATAANEGRFKLGPSQIPGPVVAPWSARRRYAGAASASVSIATLV